MVVLYIDLVQMPMQESRLWSNPYDYLILLHVTLHVILPAWSISWFLLFLQPTCFLWLLHWGIPHISGFCPNLLASCDCPIGDFFIFQVFAPIQKRRHPCLQNSMSHRASFLLMHTPHCLPPSVCSPDCFFCLSTHKLPIASFPHMHSPSSRRQNSDGRLHPSYRTSSRCPAHHSDSDLHK